MHVIRRNNLAVSLLVAIGLGMAIGVASVRVGLTPVPGVVVAILWLCYGQRRFIRRWRLTRQPLDVQSRKWLEKQVAFYRGLGQEGRSRFERDVQIVLADMRMEGVSGIQVTPELKLSVAAGIALMWFGRPDWDTPYKHTVLFYPGSFNDDFDLDNHPTFDGMARENGPILLSAPAVHYGWRHEDGLNVVLHEFAHALDFQGSGPPGLPSLLDPSSATAWKALVDHEMAKVRSGQSLLRSYAATNRAELFAVAVEQFFEQPHRLLERHPELFAALVAMFNFDPTPHA